MLRSRMRGLAAAWSSAAALLVVAVAVAVAEGNDNQHQPQKFVAAQPPHQPKATAVDADIVKNLAVFRDHAAAPASAAAVARAARASGLFGLNGALARDAGVSRPGHPLTLLPGNGYICVSGDDVGNSCVPSADLNADRPQVDTGQCGTIPQGQLSISGIAPDSVHDLAIEKSDHTTRSVAVQSNTFFVMEPIATPNPLPAAVTWTDASGAKQRLDLSLAPGTATVHCADPTP